jgi:hypothetical protein
MRVQDLDASTAWERAVLGFDLMGNLSCINTKENGEEKTMTTCELDMPRFVTGHGSTLYRKRQGETSYA